MNEPIVVDIPTFEDRRGILSVIDFPFFRRVFWARNQKGTRGHHSHFSCVQLLVPLFGTFIIITSKDGLCKQETVLTAHYNRGILIPPGLCISYTAIEDESILLVLCTESYEQDVVIPYREGTSGFEG